MNLVELQHALRQLRCSGMATGLETRLLQARTEQQPPIDFLSTLVGDELLRRQDRLLARRVQQAGFRDQDKRLDTFDFDFNKKVLPGFEWVPPRYSYRPSACPGGQAAWSPMHRLEAPPAFAGADIERGGVDQAVVGQELARGPR